MTTRVARTARATVYLFEPAQAQARKSARDLSYGRAGGDGIQHRGGHTKTNQDLIVLKARFLEAVQGGGVEAGQVLTKRKAPIR